MIVAFQSDKSCWRVKEILESTGTASCIVCKSAAEVKRVVSKQHITTVVCGYKFCDESAEGLFEDLPASCAMLLVAAGSLLDLVGNRDIFRLRAPVSKGELVASVRMLLQAGARLERDTRSHRSGAARALIEEAKAVLMARQGISEEQAHRLLQKRSMDAGTRLDEVARRVLEECRNGGN